MLATLKVNQAKPGWAQFRLWIDHTLAEACSSSIDIPVRLQFFLTPHFLLIWIMGVQLTLNELQV
jgi:hypothetical protein